MSRTLHRFVFDTSVIIAAFRSRNGASRQLLQWLSEERFIPFATPACFFEYEEVLSRREQMGVHGFSHEDIQMFLNTLARYTELVQVNYSWRPQLRDPDDEFVLEAAINGNPEAIVTFNVRDFLPEAQRFGIQVLTPGAYHSGRMDSMSNALISVELPYPLLEQASTRAQNPVHPSPHGSAT